MRSNLLNKVFKTQIWDLASWCARGNIFGFWSLKTNFRVLYWPFFTNFLVMVQFPGFFLVFLVEIFSPGFPRFPGRVQTLLTIYNVPSYIMKAHYILCNLLCQFIWWPLTESRTSGSFYKESNFWWRLQIPLKFFHLKAWNSLIHRNP